MENKINLGDCMDFMANMPDNYVDLAIVDPPYGIGETWNKSKNQQHYNRSKSYKNKSIPEETYFNELFRISKSQIIWGGNYYSKFLTPTNSWIFWDKKRNVEKTFMSEGELAWTSFKKPMRKVEIIWDGGKKGIETGVKTIHPHQKPIQLYKWLLQKYGGKNDLVLDTHSGSGSCAIACHLEGFNFIAIEKDIDYYNDSIKRLKEYQDQGLIFSG